MSISNFHSRVEQELNTNIISEIFFVGGQIYCYVNVDQPEITTSLFKRYCPKAPNDYNNMAIISEKVKLCFTLYNQPPTIKVNKDNIGGIIQQILELASKGKINLEGDLDWIRNVSKTV